MKSHTTHSTDSGLKVFKADFGNGELVFETGKLAGLADGSVTVSWGETVILATAVVGVEPREGVDFFPLMVDYEERLYAAGKISGSRFIKREGRPTDNAVLSARLIDRPIRPLFPKSFRNDVQVIITVLSYDEEHSPDTIAIVAASAALTQTIAPFECPVGAARVGCIDGKMVLNPTESQLDVSTLDLVVAGTTDTVMMIEAGAKEIPEATMIEAIEFALAGLQPTIAVQKNFARTDMLTTDASEADIIHEEVKKYIGKKLAGAIKELDPEKRKTAIATFEADVLKNFEGSYKQTDLKVTFNKIVEKEIRELILSHDIRPDGRKLDEVRPLSIEVGLLPRTHGSGLFTRGQTQALTIATLGSPGDEQTVETLEEEGTKRFMHHYNFPPFSTGEVKPMRSVGRREIGHGALAERALKPMIPDRESFPYTIRLVSEILASNGSSSMAATCGSTLALMDAGVPITKPVSGIAMGLITDHEKPYENYKVLTDLQGLEDFAGDMDFKVAGTKDGITAIQLDTKIKGLSMGIIKDTLAAALKGRLFIMEQMLSVIGEPRTELSQYAPRIYTLHIPIDKIGDVIGPGGKNIRKIVDDAGGKEVISIDIEDDGTVLVSSPKKEAADSAIAAIQGQTKEFAIGEVIDGTVEEILKDRFKGNEIGAIINLGGKNTGMVHISEISQDRIETVSSVLKVGDKVKVKVVTIDKERGRVGLSIKQNGNNHE
ncbi:polyribonucleotide nucleotidyltransferase [Candidatus Berkelbacteria bacterium CG2_30_43_20]|uniref:Polyribonucleotide nucleotidyltransferase n=1 Tax=Candidatus Berkelbacteria bacterium CG10_big_fil_rev_8_21_14_0_10_43_14 TaxID=1974515 RepID=A0A2M6R9U2_9BACT|nr:MAG: polyribonucleotide nucleotidyltransferase [Candidatus Berkelbacteria bacterium CG2_30_43_20]PIS07257.1 MAG: polyribonucleotide nucleotidyltransferase [Candidatus Berkelbacteria bacterium CG10_big_fil_rev_8_21_14_0_10_43_14]